MASTSAKESAMREIAARAQETQKGKNSVHAVITRLNLLSEERGRPAQTQSHIASILAIDIFLVASISAGNCATQIHVRRATRWPSSLVDAVETQETLLATQSITQQSSRRS